MDDSTTGDTDGLLITRSISYAVAMLGISAAHNRSREIGCLSCISILDPGGHQIAFARMDGAPFQSIGIANRKAYSVAGNGMANHEFWNKIKDEPAIVSASSQLDTGVWLGGGLPVVFDDVLVAAVAVSGRSNMEQDKIIAEAAIQAILTYLNRS